MKASTLYFTLQTVYVTLLFIAIFWGLSETVKAATLIASLVCGAASTILRKLEDLD